MSEQAMSFDPHAISAKLEELTERLCDLDFQAREPDVLDDAMKAMHISSEVTGLIFGLPLSALPTVVMFIVSQLNHARAQAGVMMEDAGTFADEITNVASQLSAQDADPVLMFGLLDIATELREVHDNSPYKKVEDAA